jgi:hypothetical protein
MANILLIKWTQYSYQQMYKSIPVYFNYNIFSKMFPQRVWPYSCRYKREYDYNYNNFRWQNVSDTFVITCNSIIILSPWRRQHKGPKHVRGYPIIELHQNTIVHLLVLIFYSSDWNFFRNCKMRFLLVRSRRVWNETVHS